MVDWRYLWSAFLEKFLARSETRNHDFQGVEISNLAKNRKFSIQGGCPRCCRTQKFFFAKIAYRLTWPQRKNFGVGVRTMGPESAKMVQIAGFRGFWIYPFLTKIPFAGSGGCRSGMKFLGKKLEILGYIPQKNHWKIPKTHGATKTSKSAFFFRSR